MWEKRYDTAEENCYEISADGTVAAMKIYVQAGMTKKGTCGSAGCDTWEGDRGSFSGMS